VIRVAEQYAGTDTGRQRRANEDALLAHAPLFVVADGMGGAQAGEVASQIAIDSFQDGLGDAPRPADALVALAEAANARIHELSHTNAEQAGMGTTLTAVYVDVADVVIAHVGDSRAYRLRDGELLRLTDDHSLVDELIRQGRLTAEEAIEHPQRSVITRALGPEGSVEVDVRSEPARAGDVYLVCSDGLTTMLDEQRVRDVLLAHARLHDAGEALIAAANEAGGRDNITVLLLRLEDAGATPTPVAAREPSAESPTESHAPAAPAAAPTRAAVAERGAVATPVKRLRPRRPPAANEQGARRRRLAVRPSAAAAVALVIVGLVAAGAYLASQSVYFIGTNSRGLVTVFRGLPFRLPANIALYSSDYVSGVAASTLAPKRRRQLLDHSLYTEREAAKLVRNLELGRLQ
jgi:PPM family protein phosphatase